MITVSPESCLQALEGLLRSAYDASLGSLEFLVAGGEAYTYGARVGTTRVFVKLHDPDGFEELDFTLRLTHALSREWGIKGVLPPLAALDGSLHVLLGPYPVTVHPYLQGRNAAASAPLGEQDVTRVGRLVGEVHRCPLATDFMGGLTERFDTECVPALNKLLATSPAPGGTPGRVADLLAVNRAALLEAASMMETLRARARAARIRYAITHGDLTLSNFMVDADGSFHIVDWNSALIGPVERDLVFFSGAGHQAFLRGYAESATVTDVSADLLSFFAYRWSLDGIAFFAHRLLTEDATSVRIDDDLSVLQSFLPFNAERISDEVASMAATIRGLPSRR